MTLSDFANLDSSKGVEVRYAGEIYMVVRIDLVERLLGLSTISSVHPLWVRYESVMLVNQ